MKTSKAKQNKTANFKEGCIYKTTDYDLFEMHPCNRDFRKDKTLAESMRKHGFMPSCAIHVKSNGPAHMIVIRGHHRLAEAKRQKLPVYFVVDNTNNEIFNLESSSHALWQTKDWVSARKNEGNEHYQALMDFQRDHNIPLSVASDLLSGTGVLHNATHVMKRGQFKIGDTTHAKKVATITDTCFSCGVKFARTGSFTRAISMVAALPEFDVAVFLQKVRSNPGLMTKRGTREDFLGEIETLYNYRLQGKRLGLKFMALENARIEREKAVALRAAKATKK